MHPAFNEFKQPFIIFYARVYTPTSPLMGILWAILPLGTLAGGGGGQF